MLTTRNKFPVACAVATPLCFGLDCESSDATCRRCKVMPQCADACACWVGRISLSEALANEERAVSVYNTPHVAAAGSLHTLEIVELYCRMFEKHFGRRIAREKLRQPKWRNFLAKAQAFCLENGIDQAVWISAQMHMMKIWLDDRVRNPRRLTFMPNMLCGEKAAHRYNVYVRRAKRQYMQANEDTLDHKTQYGSLLDVLVECDERIGRYYVMAVMVGESVSFDTAVKVSSPDSVWLAAWKGKKKFLLADYRRELIHYATRISRLRAMVNVSRDFDVRLPDRIGFKEWPNWEDLAKLLIRLYGGYERMDVDLTDVSGWRWNA